MTKSLFAGAMALALIAGAAWAQQAYDTTVSRTTTVTNPVIGSATTTRVEKTVDPVTGGIVKRTQTTQSAPTTITTTTSTVDPNVFNPSRVTTYHEERTIAPGPQTVEKSYTTEATTPTNQTTTYTRTTTTTTK